MKLVLLVLAVFATGCASEVVRKASVLSEQVEPRVYTLSGKTDFRFDSGYSRSLAEGTRLVVVGTIPEGRVLKPSNTSFAIEGRHMHEAYLVERQGRVVGFYLPVEKAFSPLSNPVPLPTKGETTK